MDRLFEAPGSSLLLQSSFGLLVFFLGAMIGSFLNVVVYRLPLSRSPAEGRSHCPACGARILARDNIPVVSWLLLRGRCRTCAAAISPRYPLVEACCGMLFLLLGFAEIVAADPAWNTWWTPLDADPARITIFAYHALAACVLMAWWLIEADGGSIPPRHAARVLAIALLLPVIFPVLHPVAPDRGMVWPMEFGRIDTVELPTDSGCSTRSGWPTRSGWFDRGFLVSSLGAAAAVLVAAAVERVRGPSRAAFLGIVLVGVVLGWQGTIYAAAVVLAAGCQNGRSGTRNRAGRET